MTYTFRCRTCSRVSSAVLLTAIGFVSSESSGETWISQLPIDARQSIVWSADYESGTLNDWTLPEFEHAGSGIFNTGGGDVAAEASDTVAHSGSWAVRTSISNAVRSQNGGRAVRLMKWTDRAWDDGGTFLPNEMYYSTWAYIPHVYNPNKYAPWDPGDGGWWNIFQFKSIDENNVSQPMWSVNIAHNDDDNTMSLYMFSAYNDPESYGQKNPVELRHGEWVHIEAYYKSATGANGAIQVWQNGRLILEADDVVTSVGGVKGTDTHPIWGIGNYTDHIDGDAAGVGTAMIYFDDSIVSTRRIYPFAKVCAIGDANCDDVFDSSDLVAVFQAGEYEDGVPMNSSWATGDWNGNAEFDSSDLVFAFQEGGYEQEPRAAVRAVPEPASFVVLLAGPIGWVIRRRHIEWQNPTRRC